MTDGEKQIFGVVGNPQKQKVWEILPRLLHWFREHRQEVYLADTFADVVAGEHDHLQVLPEHEIADRVDIILALGGDGTMLHAARVVGTKRTPILGIRVGGLGFLAEVYLDEIYDRMHRLVEGKYNIENRMTIAATVRPGGDGDRFVALNDIVVHKARPLRMLNIRVSVNGDYLNTYTADGLIVSSPTGSTAYSLSVQGPIVVPTLDAMVINPISPHSLTARPVVVPGDSTIHITFEGDVNDHILSVDGQVVVDLTEDSEIEIIRGDYPVNLVVWKERTFYDVLRRKMQWGRDPRNSD